ncbi:ATP-binding protein [Acinetobacter sp. ANC 4282]|uniref:AAA family ATPase n=1 Tax=Acinetobacter terrae TaxID=2731247 RepID=UPI001490443D|nr:ATP-binding protein [Acinetobacter terrae]NNH15274.1 ATP-binding protein [Acinetobacter terrae]
MEIQSIHIQGFKSLEDVIFEPSTGFSCLVGSNGAGKSNFCDALLFFKNIILNGVSNAIEEFGDKSLITDKDITSFSLKVKNDHDVEYRYNLSVNVQDGKIIKEELSTDLMTMYSRKVDKAEKINFSKFQDIVAEMSKYMVDVEELKKQDLKNLKKTELKKYRKSITSLMDMTQKIQEIKDEVPDILKDNNLDELSSDKTGLSSYFEGEPVYSFIESLNVYRINPLSPKIPNKIFNKSNLLIHAQNLSTILLEIQKDEDKWADLHELLSLIVPSIDEIEVKKGEFEDSLSLYFKENNRPLPAISISDGTIYTLAILTTLLWNEDKATLIIIEEPERGIHPQAIVELISFMKQIISEKSLQVIVTTHSETVVRNCALEELWLVDKINGKTQLKNAKTANPHLEETSLDQAWLMNLLNGGLPW